MNKKFTLTLILAVVLISVIAFSACGVALAEETGAWDKLNEKPDLYPSYPRLDAEATTPGFSGYVTASDVKVSEGYKLKPITSGMDAWTAYQTMRENQKNVTERAQVTNTVSNIEVYVTGGTLKGNDLDITQYASWMDVDMVDGSTYEQTISQMEQLGVPLVDKTGLPKRFGAWSKSAYVSSTNQYYSQKGESGMHPDKDAPAGINTTWLGDPDIDTPSNVSYSESQAKFDRKVRVNANVDNPDYKVYTGDDEKLTDNYRSSKNTKNMDDEGNKVIYVEYKGSDGNFGGGTFYVWDENAWDYTEGKMVPQYVGFNRDRHYKALPSRGDGISNYMVTDDTFDKTNSKIEAKTIDGYTYYVIDVKLTDAVYDWDIVTGGELSSLQGSIVEFVAFDTDHGRIQKDGLTLRYEVWDTGVIRRAIRVYSLATDDDVNIDKPTDEQMETQISAIMGLYAYGKATNNQIQEFAYSGDTVTVADADGNLTSLYSFDKGALLSFWGKVGVGVGVGAAVLIALIVTLVVLAKKGVIGKKKNKAAAETAGEGGEAENKEE